MENQTKMVKNAIIAPSILASDLSNLTGETRKILQKGADWIHIDVMDGHFVDNITIGYPVVKCLRQNIPEGFFDVHMMVSSPEKWVEKFASAGASQYTFHIEAVSSPEEAENLCKKIADLGMKAGVSVKPKTPIESIFFLLNKKLIHTVLVMTVEPGFGGQKFMVDMMPKVSTLKSKYPGVIVEVDGGLDLETTKIAAEHGATAIVAGTSIFKAEDLEKTIKEMRMIVEKFTSNF